ncbi:hypothetical protein [Microbispora rosea]|uniref:hypothetical protein n=1 Tax=Microbispora rosea TaxID=58117 RepID=UPI0037AAE5C0
MVITDGGVSPSGASDRSITALGDTVGVVLTAGVTWTGVTRCRRRIRTRFA